jgi:hypothetical protein
MRITFRRQILALAMLALAGLTTNAAMAQCKLKVPFSFVAAGKSYPAGTYTVTSDKMMGMLRVYGADGRSFSAISIPGPDVNPNTASLKFDHLGGTYYLNSIHDGWMATARLDSHIKETVPGPEIASLQR